MFPLKGPDPLGDMLRAAMHLESLDVDPGNQAITAIQARTGKHRAPGLVARCRARFSKKPPEGPNPPGALDQLPTSSSRRHV